MTVFHRDGSSPTFLGAVCRLSLLAVIIFMGSCDDPPSQRDRGQFEVSQYIGPVPLEGSWEFYENRLLSPQDFGGTPAGDSEIIQVPGCWTHQGYALYGQGTYRSRISVAGVQNPGLLLPKIFSASKVWVNGKRVDSQGLTSDSSYYDLVLEELAPLPKADSYEIVIHVVNWDFWKAGLVDAPVIGEYEQLFYRMQAKSSMYLLWIGCLGLMMLLHLTLFANSSKVLPYLFAGLFGFALLLRITVLGDHFIYYYLKTNGLLTASLQAKVYFASLSLLLGIGGMYVQAIYPLQLRRRWTRYLSFFFLGLAVLFLLVPIRWFVPYRHVINVFFVMGALWFSAHMLLGWRRNRSFVQLVAIIVLVLLGLVDLVAPVGTTTSLLFVGLSAFLLVQFLYISEQYGIAFLRVKRRNHALDETVRERTRTIIAQK
ncbi:MAG: hypothetical protein AAGA85_00190 [Bacteroidota bacterium]